MQEVVLVVHLILTISLVVMVLIQRSSGGALGIGGGGGGQGGMMAGRGSATVLTKITTFLAVGFFITSLGLAVIAKEQATDSSVFDVEVPVIEQTEPENTTEPVIPDS